MVLTSVCIKAPANGRAVLIHSATVTAIEMFAPVLHIKKPLSLLDKDGRFFMTDIPADIFKIISAGGLVYLQGKIFAAESAALATAALHLLFHPLPQLHLFSCQKGCCALSA